MNDIFTYGSVASGIEAATLAWEPLGWRPAWFSEIEKFPRAVLKHRYPHVPNLGDMTKIHEQELFNERAIDLLVGGTPCQSFSVAGLRKGLADPRGNLALVFLSILDRKRPQWVVWENVPGVLSSWSDAEAGEEGCIWQTNDFDTFLSGLRELGYGIAWRVLDAQHFGVPQRRRRVFVVGYLGDWRRAAAVLFERHSLSWDPPPSRKTGEGPAGTLAARTRGGGGLGTDFDLDEGLDEASIPQTAGCLQERDAKGSDSDSDTKPGHLIPIAFSSKDHGGDAGETSPTLRAGGHHKSHANAGVPPAIALQDTRPGNGSKKQNGKGWSNDQKAYTLDSTGGQGVAQPVAFESRFTRNGRGKPSKIVPPLKAQSGQTGKGDAAPLVAYDMRGNGNGETVPTLTGDHLNRPTDYTPCVTGMRVRRLTPLECERLQGFPDGYTDVPFRGRAAADGPRSGRWAAL